MKSGISIAAVIFLALIMATSIAIGVCAVGTPTHETSSVILPANTSFKVVSSADCLAGHYSLNFSVADQSKLTGGFSAEAPGVAAYVATIQQASSTFQGHPANWVYSTGIVNSSHFAVVLSPGSYVVWIEGADQNCGSSIVMPLEMLTQVNITEDFTLTGQFVGGLLVRLELNSSRVVSGATVGINVSDYNPSPTQLNLSREAAWALDGLSTGVCPSLYYPFGIAVFQGRYTSTNVSQATPLRIFPAVACPMLVRYITGYLFQPMSDNAIVLPGTGQVSMATGVSLSGTYNARGNQLNRLTPFSLGLYTIVAGDEWGNLVFAHFVVAPSSNGVAKYVYPTSNLTSTISATVGETFIIQLSSNAGSTGYDWNVSTSTGIQYLNYTVVSTSELIGGPQVRNYFFSAVQAGTQTITLRDERSFAPYAIAATINLQVVTQTTTTTTSTSTSSTSTSSAITTSSTATTPTSAVTTTTGPTSTASTTFSTNGKTAPTPSSSTTSATSTATTSAGGSPDYVFYVVVGAVIVVILVGSVFALRKRR